MSLKSATKPNGSWGGTSMASKSASLSAAKTAAERVARKIEGQLAAGTYLAVSKRTWKEFREALDIKILAAMEPATKSTTETAVKHFERTIRPGMVAALTTDRVAEYVAVRRQEKRSKAEDATAVSPAKINRELRKISASLNIAHD
ncbi:MAG TPA: hypothetical protein VGG64_01170 [Pirellulales bacterium]|jgi:hypothetical protein